MLLVRILENKLAIRLFGVALLLSPAINLLLTMSIQPVQDPWSMAQFYKVLGAATLLKNFLSVSSFILGLAMLSGSAKMWKFVMALLGMYILIQLTRLGQDIRAHWAYGLSFVINVAVFFFIADQLVFKVKKKTPPLPKEAPPPTIVTTRKPKKEYNWVPDEKIWISCGSETPWAYIQKIDLQKIVLVAIDKAPPEALQNEYYFDFPGGLQLKAKFSSRKFNKFNFEFTEDYSDLLLSVVSTDDSFSEKAS